MNITLHRVIRLGDTGASHDYKHRDVYIGFTTNAARIVDKLCHVYRGVEFMESLYKAFDFNNPDNKITIPIHDVLSEKHRYYTEYADIMM